MLRREVSLRIGARLSGHAVRGVLVDGTRVLAQASADGGRALGAVLNELGGMAPGAVQSVTLDISDVLLDALRRPDLEPGGSPVGVLRVLPRPPQHPAVADHPSDLLRSFVRYRATVAGGHDLFGAPLAPLDQAKAVEAARAARELGLGALAVVATGAVGSPGHESAVAEAVLDAVPELQVSLSHEVGGIGLLMRETAAVLNAVLLSVAGQVVDRCERATRRLGNVPCWFATSDGGRASAERLRALPVIGLEARAAMTLRGAAVRNEVKDAVMLIEDGDTYLIGEVRDGLPRVAPDLRGTLGLRLAAPQAVSTVVSTAAFHANRSRWLHGALGSPVSVIQNIELDLAAVGAASCEPTAWLDAVVHADSADELRARQRTMKERVLSMVVAGETPPGTERIIESSAVSLTYIPSGAYRLRVRAAAGTSP